MAVTSKSRVAVMVSIVIVACSPSSPLSPVGVTRSGSKIQILFVNCESEAITSVALLDASDERVFWKIRGSNGSQVIDELLVGETPVGFEEVVALTDDPMNQEELLAIQIVTNQRTPASIEFRAGELAEREVLAEAVKPMVVERFRERPPETTGCR